MKFSKSKTIIALFSILLVIAAIFVFSNSKIETSAAVKGQSLSKYDVADSLPQTQSTKDKFKVKNFSISIPSIDLNHDIKYNVDPRKKSIYLPILEDYIAHGMFTALPSPEDGRVYLFAHSKKATRGVTPYAGYFSHIDLLDKGDLIQVNFNDKIYTYKVRESIIVEPSRVDIYTGESDRAEVALQTCYPPGTTEKRLIVFGDLTNIK